MQTDFKLYKVDMKYIRQRLLHQNDRLWHKQNLVSVYVDKYDILI